MSAIVNLKLWDFYFLEEMSSYNSFSTIRGILKKIADRKGR